MPWAVVVSDDAGCGLGGKPELCTRSISRQTGSDPTFEASTALKILRSATKPQPATAAQAQEFEQARRQQELQQVRELRDRLKVTQQTAPPPGMPLGLQPPTPGQDGPTLGMQ